MASEQASPTIGCTIICTGSGKTPSPSSTQSAASAATAIKISRVMRVNIATWLLGSSARI